MSAAANPTSGAYRDRSKDPGHDADVDLEKGIGVREHDVQVVEREPTASSLSPSKPSPIATTTTAPPSSNNRASKSSSKRTSTSSQKRDSTKPSKRHSKTHRRTGSSTPSLASPRGSKHLPPRSPLSSTPPPPPPANDDNASLSSLTPSLAAHPPPPINVTKYTMSRRLSPYWSTKRGYATIAAIALLFVGVIVGAAVGGVLSNKADQKAGDKEAEASSAAESASASSALETGSVGRRGYEIGVPVVTAAGRQFAMRGGARPAFAFVPTPAPTATSL
ncbi:hypothetical protein DFP72DRAFT_856405 [Ephemerocybe angulata]|uniref:Uncharacterized protein n=1 Tax=Ephemerocybe angulata TaxID=980116 RepID=A0A8H6HG03_9AGAR|nr:hypothetical protein DFP72DRAFT_856405 [Tulosesus angulatus]